MCRIGWDLEIDSIQSVFDLKESLELKSRDFFIETGQMDLEIPFGRWLAFYGILEYLFVIMF